MKRRDFLATSLGLPIAGLGLPFAVSAGPSEEPPRPGHRILDLELLDVQRQRPVPARLYMPYRASPDASVPMVVFSHGLGGSRMGYSYLARHWADVGVASLHPQHVGSDSHVWRGNPLGLVQRLQLAASDDEALDRVLDLRFALDQILGSQQGQLIDVTKIAVAGHSYGANTAMLVAGAKVNTDNANLGELRDQRIQAAILISAPPLLGQGPAQQVLGEVRIPTLHITSLKDTINLPGYRSTVEDRIAIFDAMSASPRTLVVFNTGGHSIFTDRTTSSGPETSERIKGATREISTIFLRHALKPERPTVNSQSTVDQWEVDKKSTLLPMDLLAQQNMKQWINQHMDLVDRFETPGNTLP
jgi:predicted dienelactone hydrolase